MTKNELHGFKLYHASHVAEPRCYVWVMKRRFALFCAAGFAAACGGGAAVGEPPATLGGGAWSRQSIERPAVAGAPEKLRAYNPAEWLRAEYRKGESAVTVDVYRMPGEPSAFEARQKWLGESGAASINHGDLFVVVSSKTEPASGLGQFLRLMEAEWLSVHRR